MYIILWKNIDILWEGVEGDGEGGYIYIVYTI